MAENMIICVRYWYCGAWCFSKILFAQKYIKIIFLQIVFFFFYINILKSLGDTKKNINLMFFQAKHSFKYENQSVPSKQVELVGEIL